jgi:hypothetical protein
MVFLWVLKRRVEMPARDEVVGLVGITQREHFMRRSSTSGRIRYPFKNMIRGDYFVVELEKEAQGVRNALKSFYKRYPTRRFTVRQGEEDWIWIVRRV